MLDQVFRPDLPFAFVQSKEQRVHFLSRHLLPSTLQHRTQISEHNEAVLVAIEIGQQGLSHVSGKGDGPYQIDVDTGLGADLLLDVVIDGGELFDGDTGFWRTWWTISSRDLPGLLAHCCVILARRASVGARFSERRALPICVCLSPSRSG